jgi:hypothetical protein
MHEANPEAHALSTWQCMCYYINSSPVSHTAKGASTYPNVGFHGPKGHPYGLSHRYCHNKIRMTSSLSSLSLRPLKGVSCTSFTFGVCSLIKSTPPHGACQRTWWHASSMLLAWAALKGGKTCLPRHVWEPCTDEKAKNWEEKKNPLLSSLAHKFF